MVDRIPLVCTIMDGEIGMLLRCSDEQALVHAPAKLNLFLEVLARRADGFHEIETLITSISLFDTLRFTNNSDGELRLSCGWAAGIKARGRSSSNPRPRSTAEQPNSDRLDRMLGQLPQANENLVITALEGIRERVGIGSGATIELTKRIPSAAGLGGASTDVAAALVAANHCWRLGWTRQQLARFSAEYGSDIPYFFYGGACVCRGRGELVEAVDGLGRLDVVVVRPPSGLSTAEVYQHCRVAAQPLSVGPMLESARSGRIDGMGRLLANRLQDVALRLSPWIQKVQREFQRLDCLGHQLSGSGSSYFGLCRNARHARRVAGRLSAVGIGTVFCASTVSAPLHRL